MNIKKIKKLNEYLDEKKNYLVTDKNYKCKDISQRDLDKLFEKIE